MVDRVVLVAPRGFCAGVVRAVDIVERALVVYGAPVYVRRPIVHNSHVVARLAAKGAIFVQEIDEVPPGAIVVFSAHGVAPSVRQAAAARGLDILDATCPLVAKVHREVRCYLQKGYEVVLIGHADHDEVVGTLGQAPGRIHLVERPEDVNRLGIANFQRVACVTQTTLSPEEVAPIMEALGRRFPGLVQPPTEDICFATRNRQEAVRWLAQQVEIVLVLGDTSSSNAQRLREVALRTGTSAYLIGRITEFDPAVLRHARLVGLTAAASTPEEVVHEAVAHFRAEGAVVEEVTLQVEHTWFPLPGFTAQRVGMTS
ncbi:MAG: 4-hydroxy-3-methylbut-2-enyl diphosphate reductase [Chloroflexota bacterium]